MESAKLVIVALEHKLIGPTPRPDMEQEARHGDDDRSLVEAAAVHEALFPVIARLSPGPPKDQSQVSQQVLLA